MDQKYTIQSPLWKWNGPSAWYFITINGMNAEIIKARKEPTPGFGQIKVSATIGKTTWQTSIFPNKEGEYLIPIKAAIRKKENLSVADKYRPHY